MILAFLRNNQARIVDTLYERIHQTTRAEAHFVLNELRDNIARGAAAFLSALEANDLTAIDHFITDLIAPRTVEEFPLAVLHRAFTFDTHEWLSLLAIGFTVLHVGALLFDRYLPFSIVEVLVPFTASYRPVWVGAGVIGMYLTLLVTATFYLRRQIGQKTFRAIHLFSFAGYASVSVHSLFSGTDSSLLSAKLIYATCALVVLCLTLWYVQTRRAATHPHPITTAQT